MMSKIIRFVYFVFTGVLCALVLVSFLGNLHVFLELLGQFRVIYAGLLFLSIAVSLLLKRKILSVSLILLFVVNLAPVIPLYFGKEFADSDSASISVLQLNVWPRYNNDFEKAINLIQSRSPDVIGFTELSKEWKEKVVSDLKQYPYSFSEDGRGGIMILSRYQLKNSRLLYTGEIKRPRIYTQCVKNGKTYSFVLAHTVSPLNGLDFRKEELALVAREVKEFPRPFVLFGDLNCGPFSPYFKNLLEVGELKDTEKGYGLQCTWPAFAMPFVPIDHVLVSNDLICAERIVGPDIGSDHLPVYVKLVFVLK